MEDFVKTLTNRYRATYLKVLHSTQHRDSIFQYDKKVHFDCFFMIGSEPQVPFRRKLQDVEVQEKKSAMLMCEVPLFATQTNWFMEETRLEQSSKYHMEQEGTLRRLTIHNVTTNDDGVYICEMKEGSRTVAELSVRGMVQ